MPRTAALPTRAALEFCAAFALTLYAALILYPVMTSEGPVPRDFMVFWVVGQMAAAGQAAAAYDWGILQEALTTAAGQAPPVPSGWLNPPSFLLMITPFALLPYGVAWAAWCILTAAFFVAGLREVLPLRAFILAAVAAPATYVCTIFGQNGFLIAGLFAFGLALLERRPWLAGVCIGLLTCKPHLGLLLAPLLVIGGHWRAFAAASGVALALAGLSAAAFGWDAWAAFPGAMQGNVTRQLGGANETLLSLLQTVHGAAMRALGSWKWAVALHAAVALPAVAAAAWAWRRQGTSPEVRAVTALAGCFLLTPYALLYDQVPLVVAAAFLTRAGLRDGFLPWERLGICLACALPAAALFLHSGLIAPAAWVLLLGLALRRMAISSRPTRR